MDSARARTRLHLHDEILNRTLRFDAYCLQHIGLVTPSAPLPIDAVEHTRGLQLADPQFATPGGVDIIIGANVYGRLLLPGILHRERLLAQKTVFGWTFTGTATTNTPAARLSVACAQATCHERLLELVQRFWSLEDVPRIIKESAADAECERLFIEGHSRDPAGRYIVPIPLKKDGANRLGESLAQAKIALTTMHRRMQRDPRLADAYAQFMDEYLRSGHMRPLTPDELQNPPHVACYICHHGIWQRCDEGDKLRVVFNASRPTTSGDSLNDVMHAGPKLQSDLAIVVTRWRTRRIAFCADIKMMFRQIRIRPEHTHLQRILWSPRPGVPATHYALLTVTYGEASAPYLALRTLRQLCSDEGTDLPEAVDAVNQELYVDDFLSGADDLPSAIHRRNQLVELLRRGGFTLKKWVSNSPELLEDIDPTDRLRPTWLQFSTDGPVNELGVAWDPTMDCFRLAPPAPRANRQLSKRAILAELARIFDPAGWLAPITVVAKMLVQDLWRAKLDWDESVPEPWAGRWAAFQEALRDVPALTVPRWIQLSKLRRIELHAFADASRRAMATALYSRTFDSCGEDVATSLLWAKTKLSPIRSLIPSQKAAARMTIPRLELRAALLAAKLLQFVASSLDVPLTDCHLWGDSQVVLHWLSSDGPTGSNLVDDYVAHIHELAPGVKLHYVPTDDNPADIATRGTDARGLNQSSLWWSGPAWLKEKNWPDFRTTPDDCAPNQHAEINVLNCAATQAASPVDVHPIDKFSSLDRLLKSMARCRRLYRARLDANTPPARAPVRADEMHQEYIACARISQKASFGPEIIKLQQGQQVRQDSPLRNLAPFLDDTGLLRVGGRLRNSLLPLDEKHPVILHGRSHFAQLVIKWAHLRSLHSGFRTTYVHAIGRAWIVGRRARVRSYIKRCMVCARANAKPMTQVMADLPAARVTPSAPFLRTGVDYAGPFQVLRSKGRGSKPTKGYVAVFVCLATKAIHLELVGDLTTQSFLGALDRFTGRRGQPQEMWSDNGTTFRGASAELHRQLRAAEMDWHKVEGRLAQQGITWRFIPPSAPHFGGIWEAGVKSTKSHLQRVAGPRRLTFEEFSTLLVNIERVLNCRPLTPLSGEPDDLEVLTPAHFLTGRSLAPLPQPHATDLNLDQETHWDLVKGLRDTFWARWSREYLNTLQQRAKWTSSRPNISVGDLVVIMDPPLLNRHGRWPLGRVTATHPGQDNVVRVVTVKTADSEYTRPITKLVRLPAGSPDPPAPQVPQPPDHGQAPT